MKQHITRAQLDELTVEQLYKLNNILPKGVIGSVTDELLNKLAEQVTIGQMIEILDYKLDRIANTCAGYQLMLVENAHSVATEPHKELCDALLSAVKSIL